MAGAATAEQRRRAARALAAEKMAERQEREKKIGDVLAQFLTEANTVDAAADVRDSQIAKAHAAFEKASEQSRERQRVHVQSLKGLGLVEKEIATLTGESVSFVREAVKEAAAESPRVKEPVAASAAEPESVVVSDVVTQD